MDEAECAPAQSSANEMKRGALAILPLALGASVYGMAFGLLAVQVGFPWWGVGIMSVSTHAGSSQIVAVEQFASTGVVLGAVLAGAALNLRYVGIVASLSGVLNGLPLRKKLFAIHITGDENWALTMSERAKSPAVGAPFLIGSGLMNISMWTASTTLGALLGAVLPDLGRFGLGFAFTAAFIAMARSLWRGFAQALPWAAAAGATIAVTYLGMPRAYAIVTGAFLGLAVVYIKRRMKAVGE
ncbi:AzlC family ABC transporter permease [Rhizobium pusense]|uniref:AzlC family ABC transporter permease n=1 Tax=Agrobacterium pusense TaxID=648995 RepID=UPI0018E549FD|nr:MULTISPECIES: AzlC family ABC transporter permease [Alphaproteobacteria]MDH0908519.1 AzlC family ABC transporter permease [Agrobacterium pusense]MDH1094351.1 AzlC family ABC transporter permease [Agrobacterium pusense]MDH1110933.1 AzlC family ABC transporter permease [Agrobacterium pusense]MDH2192063.1 AzlC family ABC transporter permease [Agrobacterium pusense]